ncbi:putative subtilisin-like protein [Botrytis fragariae]|uniref:Putative subtilisin-like protein n=1 Tax=Botrytis fragariae TaxID=1964551 RepID=A0A8H6AJ07_9HELO|nr:putative subtilisin-like protein [Botrytis fragariae]KAF5868249.1 putative subtilisin-like protein [Botrytis fragariae]
MTFYGASGRSVGGVGGRDVDAVDRVDGVRREEGKEKAKRREEKVHVVHEKRSSPPPKWKRSARLHPQAVIPVRIGLTQQNLHRAEEFINQVSHPESPLYGQHWSASKIADMFAPSRETVEVVRTWLHEAGIAPERVRVSKGGAWISFNATTEEAEGLLRTRYFVWEHEEGGRHVACGEYSVPSGVSAHVDFVTPGVAFDGRVGGGGGRKQVRQERDLPEPLKALNRRAEEVKRRRRDGMGAGIGMGVGDTKPVGKMGSPEDASNPKQGADVKNALMTLANCDTMITTACLQALYNFPPGSKSATNNTLGVVEYTPQAFLQTDLNMWFDQFSPNQANKVPIVDLIDGAVVQQTNQSFAFNGESALDLEFAMALINPQQVTVFQVGDLVEGGSFNNFLEAIDASYCTAEGGDSKDPNVDGQYPDTKPGGFPGELQCGRYQSTKVISTSYSANEADLGAKYEMRQCNEYMKLGLQGVSVLYSSGDFGVAGNGGQCIDSKTGAYNNGSSGMFNPSFPGTCPYVTSVGATQILNGSTVHSPESAASKSPPGYGAERYNNSKLVRGYPDVSANGVNYVTAVNGQFSLAFGTSASCPAFAAMLNLVNEERIAGGKSTVGFVNPVLYKNQAAMNDITSGRNPGCGTDGFEAVQGWDPVTGLGTPDYGKLVKVFMGLP